MRLVIHNWSQCGWSWLILENLALLLQIYNKLFSFYFAILSVSSFCYDIVFNVLWADFCLNDMFSKKNHFWNWFIAITSKDQRNAGFSSVSVETGETSHLEVSHPCVHLNFWVSLFLTCVSILFVKAHKTSKGYSGENEMILSPFERYVSTVHLCLNFQVK